MAKKIYRRKYYRSKGRWSANINNFGVVQIIQGGVSGRFYGYETLQTNPIQQSSLVSQQYTVKNIELSFEIETMQSQSVNVENCQCYIMYLPQGMNVSDELPFQHPEYILAYRFLGSPSIDSTDPKRNPLFVKTRMARRLQTGDSLIFLFLFDYAGPTSDTITVQGICRYWTKAN